MKGAKTVNKFGKTFVAKTIYGKDHVLKNDVNIANMNVFNYIYFWVLHWDCNNWVDDYKSIVKEFFKSLYILLFGTFIIITLPLTLPINAYMEIKKSKNRLNKRKEF